ncbi:MAG: EamA family transporter [Chitinophagales bacterium]|nr:EamA family transporter [Chitinophagales bacterium]MDW8394358.1 EamA family transporter [Chitinophagales bacterium]
MKGSVTAGDWLLLFAISLIWGSSFILIDRSLHAFAPTQVACLRIVLSAVVLLPFFLQRRHTLDFRQTRHITVQSLFGNFVPAFLFPAAQVHVNSATAGIMNSLSPAWAFLLGLLFFGASFRWMQLAGIAVAFAGAVMLLFQPAKVGATAYGTLLILATLCYGLSSNLVNRHLRHIDALSISSTGFVILSFPALIILFGTAGFVPLLKDPQAWQSLGYIALLAVMGSAVASTLFYRLLQRTNTLFAMSVTYLMPVVALLWGWLSGETLSFTDLAGMALILGGIYLLSRRPSRQSY